MIGVIGGFISGSLGLGGGSIYNPALFAMGCHRSVASSTGMYLVLFATINTCTVFWINDDLPINYGLWISAWSLVGTVLGLWLTDLYSKRSGRQSVFIWILVVMFGMSAIVIPITSSNEIVQEVGAKIPVWQFTSICP